MPAPAKLAPLKLTRRQKITAAALINARDGRHITHTELASKFGVTRSAITKRMQRFLAKLSADQKVTYFRAIGRKQGPRRRVFAHGLNFPQSV